MINDVLKSTIFYLTWQRIGFEKSFIFLARFLQYIMNAASYFWNYWLRQHSRYLISHLKTTNAWQAISYILNVTQKGRVIRPEAPRCSTLKNVRADRRTCSLAPSLSSGRCAGRATRVCTWPLSCCCSSLPCSRYSADWRLWSGRTLYRRCWWSSAPSSSASCVSTVCSPWSALWGFKGESTTEVILRLKLTKSGIGVSLEGWGSMLGILHFGSHISWKFISREPFA